MQAKKPKLILHFDVNKTIIFEDSIKGITGEEMVSYTCIFINPTFSYKD